MTKEVIQRNDKRRWKQLAAEIRHGADGAFGGVDGFWTGLRCDSGGGREVAQRLVGLPNMKREP